MNTAVTANDSNPATRRVAEAKGVVDVNLRDLAEILPDIAEAVDHVQQGLERLVAAVDARQKQIWNGVDQNSVATDQMSAAVNRMRRSDTDGR